MKQAFKLFLTNEYEVLYDLEKKGKQMKCHILLVNCTICSYRKQIKGLTPAHLCQLDGHEL